MEPGFLERAIELAERGRGTTRPNPIVGAVIVSEGEIVGEGWHERKGGQHAEVAALTDAGERARGATVYVTLEPCAHHGATPPCVDALLEAGVAGVVAGQLDPNPAHGGGLELLREAGVVAELAEGDTAFRCRQQIEEWRTWVTAKRPHVTYKVARHARRPRARPRLTLGHRRGLQAPRPRTPRAVRRRRGRDGHGALRQPTPRRARCPRDRAAAENRVREWPAA